MRLTMPFVTLTEDMVRHTLEKVTLPDFVRRLKLEMGHDTQGDPAVWVYVILRDDAGENYSQSQELAQQLRQVTWTDLPLQPFIRFRTESEQSELDAERKR